MIHSMTGFGSAHRVEGDLEYALEIRSLNSRYFKIAAKLPEFLQFAEGEIEKMVRRRLARGTVSYTLRVRGGSERIFGVIDHSALQRYVDQLASARVPDGITPSIDLAMIAALPGICQAPELGDEQRHEQLAIMEELTSQALDALVTMRREEGRAICADLLSVCAQARNELAKIEVEAPSVVEEHYERMKSRVAKFVEEGGYKLNEEGLLRELAILADRCDINEEVTRLKSHFDQFEESCRQGDQVGRKLDFVTQELLREANTIGNKTNNVRISRSVVEMKGMIERLKEQVQNVQ
jgi:uncharacterized protein (TIGR00255 family)